MTRKFPRISFRKRMIQDNNKSKRLNQPICGPSFITGTSYTRSWNSAHSTGKCGGMILRNTLQIKYKIINCTDCSEITGNILNICRYISCEFYRMPEWILEVRCGNFSPFPASRKYGVSYIFNVVQSTVNVYIGLVLLIPTFSAQNNTEFTCKI